jgi:hypothetical protein
MAFRRWSAPQADVGDGPFCECQTSELDARWRDLDGVIQQRLAAWAGQIVDLPKHGCNTHLIRRHRMLA